MTNPFSAFDQSFFKRLDGIVRAHMEWTGRVLRCALLKQSPGDDVLASDAHCRCRLGRWLSKTRGELEQIDASGLANLTVTHQRMHDAVRSLCRELLAGREIDEREIEKFVRCQGDLLAGLTQLKTELIANSARIDALTKLPLRYSLEREYAQHGARAQRHGLTPYLALLDVDHFKRINDTYGHAMGDRALVHVADVLRDACRRDEPLFRFGGEEFLLLLEAPSDEAAAKGVDRLLCALREHPLAVNPVTVLRICASCGIVGITCGEPLAEALVRADLGLYAAKAGGRDCFAWGSSHREAA